MSTALLTLGFIPCFCQFSDSKIRLFSKNPQSQSSAAAIKMYEAELASSQVAAGSLGEIEKHNLPEVEALAIPGSFHISTNLLHTLPIWLY